MNINALTYMEKFYLALGDKTRLRIIKLIGSGEVCVGDFAQALGESQPKISRHLAYLKNAGIVNVRRDGKWMFYSLATPPEPGGRIVLDSALSWLSDQTDPGAEKGYRLSTHGFPNLHDTVDREEDHPEAPEKDYEEKLTQADPQPIADRPAHNEIEDYLL